MGDGGAGWPKLVLLLALTVLLMRLLSWGLHWVAHRLLRLGPGASVVAANLTALAIFVAALFLDLEEGEPMDGEAVAFGAVVFGLLLLVDWLRARRRAGSQTGA